METRCKSCVRVLEYRTCTPCRYCTNNTERHRYLSSICSMEVKDYYREARPPRHTRRNNYV